MAEAEGKLLTCDLCGATVFLKYVNDGIRKHEDPPEGWGHWHVGDVIHSTLCPSCNERMQEALLACVNGIKEVDLRMTDHKCPQNATRNEVWPETDWCKPMLVLVGGTETGRFEHSERINFCPYCGKDLRKKEVNNG